MCATTSSRCALAGLMIQVICNGRQQGKRRKKIGKSESIVSVADFGSRVSRWTVISLLDVYVRVRPRLCKNSHRVFCSGIAYVQENNDCGESGNLLAISAEVIRPEWEEAVSRVADFGF
jgi:hypothetical protein